MTTTFTCGARRTGPLSLVALATVGLMALSGCGSSSDTTTSQQGQGYAQRQDPGTGGGMPGASGEIAAVDGSTLQVQGSDTQTAVTYTDQTTISQQVSAVLADVAVGSCVMVTPADGSEPSETAVAAGTVQIAEKTDGACAGGGGFGGRQRPEGRPSDMPEGLPSGGPGGMGGMGGMGTSGEVTAVSDNGFTVAATARDSEETTSVSVTVGSETTYTTTETATKSALTIGRCVLATGETDDTGAVTAERISVSDPVDGECAPGFMGRVGTPGGAPSQDGASS